MRKEKRIFEATEVARDRSEKVLSHFSLGMKVGKPIPNSRRVKRK